MNGMTSRVILQCIEENLLGLGVTAVSHVDICLGNRIDAFVGADV